MQYWVRSR